MARLSTQRSLVDHIADYAKAKYCSCQAVAAIERFAAGELGECLVVVLRSSGNVPKGWVEDDTGGRDYEHRISCLYTVSNPIGILTPEARLTENHETGHCKVRVSVVIERVI